MGRLFLVIADLNILGENLIIMVLVDVRPLRGCRLCSYIDISFLCIFTYFIIKLRKLLNCDWLGAGQFLVES